MYKSQMKKFKNLNVMTQRDIGELFLVLLIFFIIIIVTGLSMCRKSIKKAQVSFYKVYPYIKISL